MNLRGPFLFVIIFLGGLFVCVIAGGWFLSGFQMTSTAMEPTIKSGQIVFVNRMLLRTGDPKRGDVILLQVPGEETQVVRRVIALPGERIECRFQEVYINDKKLDEPYLRARETEEPQIEAPAPDAFGPTPVPEECFFVLGDNRRTSRDSRSFGFVKREFILGKVLLMWGFFAF